MPKSPTRPTQYPSPQWARALHRGKPRHSCRGGRPEGSGGHDRKLHQALPFHVGGGIGPESITRKSEMANHNSRVLYPYVAVERSPTPVSPLSEPQRWSVGDVPLPAGT